MNIAGMVLVINEAPEQHPPLPVGFPVCGDYDIGADGYKMAADNVSGPTSGKGSRM